MKMLLRDFTAIQKDEQDAFPTLKVLDLAGKETKIRSFYRSFYSLLINSVV